MTRKLHIGGQVRAEGWEILDANPGSCVDHVGNAADLQRFGDNSFSHVYASHVLEHFDYVNELTAVLQEWRRILIPGGALWVSVPDLDVPARLFLNHDSLTRQDRFMVMRMIFGGHMHQYDYHLVGLNEEFLADALRVTGFTDVNRVREFGLFDDTSAMRFKDVSISVNIKCTKPFASTISA